MTLKGHEHVIRDESVDVRQSTQSYESVSRAEPENQEVRSPILDSFRARLKRNAAAYRFLAGR
jgi:hypothetical protein